MQEHLDDLGVAYVENPRMVRGLDYYTKTTFEFVHSGLGAALSRLEIPRFVSAQLPRLTHVELSGPAAHVATTFVGGLKHLPIRYSLK